MENGVRLLLPVFGFIELFVSSGMQDFPGNEPEVSFGDLVLSIQDV